MSRILRVLMVMVVSLASVLAHAVGSSDNTDFSQGASAMQISLQKEVYGILLSDTAEVQQEYRADGTFYTSDALAPYRSILKTICAEAARSDCPDITFTKRTLQGIAAMYPNGVLALNEELMARLTLDEARFIMCTSEKPMPMAMPTLPRKASPSIVCGCTTKLRATNR